MKLKGISFCHKNSFEIQQKIDFMKNQGNIFQQYEWLNFPDLVEKRKKINFLASFPGEDSDSAWRRSKCI